MPLTVKPECAQCETKESAMWRQVDRGLVCCSCFATRKEEEKADMELKVKDEIAQEKTEHVEIPKALKAPLRKSTRMTRNYKTRGNPYALPKPMIGRGRGRRSHHKKIPMRSQIEGRCWVKTNRVYLVEGYLREGDVVSLCGPGDSVYYAQLRGFVCDMFGEKLGVITWLLPKAERTKSRFVPEDFYLGPDEDTPRRLDTMELEYRVPSGFCRFYQPPHELNENYVREIVEVS